MIKRICGSILFFCVLVVWVTLIIILSPYDLYRWWRDRYKEAAIKKLHEEFNEKAAGMNTNYEDEEGSRPFWELQNEYLKKKKAIRQGPRIPKL